jgi:hypothetical protein
MADLQYSMAIDDKISPTLKKVQTQVSGLNTNFIRLRETLLKISLGAIASQTLDFARNIQQASNATDIAISTVNNFANAVGQLGGSTNKAIGDVIDFVAGLKDAKDGGAGAQASLAKVGVTLSDLANLSNEDIFKKTIDGLAKIEDASVRNALAVKLLGKNFKDVDVRQVAKGMQGGGGANVSAINAAADAQKNLSAQLDNLRSALLNVAEPLNKLLAKISFTTAEFENLIKIIGMAAGAYFIFTRGLTGVTSAMNSVMNSLRGGGGVLTWFLAQLKSIGNNAALFFKNLGLVVINAGVALGIFAKGAGTAAGVLGSLAAMAANVLRVLLRFAGIAGVIYTVVEAMSFLEKKFIGTNYIDKFFEAIAIGMEKVIGYIPGLKSFAKLMEDTRKGLTSEAGAGRGGNADTLKQQLDHAEKLRQESQATIDANRALKLELDKNLTSYQNQNTELSRTMAFQNSLIGMDETRASRATKLFELESGYLQQMRTIQEKFNEMKAAAAVGTDEERLAFAAFSKIYEAGMAKITSEYKGQVSEVNALVNQEEVLLAKEKNRQIIIDGITQQMERQATLGDQIRSAYDKLKDVQFEGAQMQRNPMEKQFAQIREDARKAAREASLAFAAGFEGMDLSIQQANELANGLEKIAQSYGKIAEAQMENIKQSRTFDQGWKEAFNSYIDESSNAANRGREAFSAFGSNINSAIDNFVTTGKFKFSDFARSIIQDLLKIELKAQASKLFSGMISTAGGFLSSLLGFAEGGQPPVGKPSIVGEKGPELFVPKTAGTIVPNGGSVGNAAQGNTYITNNISAIDAKSVAQLFAENRKTLFGSVQMAQKEMSYGR